MYCTEFSTVVPCTFYINTNFESLYFQDFSFSLLLHNWIFLNVILEILYMSIASPLFSTLSLSPLMSPPQSQFMTSYC